MNSSDNQFKTTFQEVSEAFADNTDISVTPGEGSPPDQYTVTYHLKGACKEPDGEVSTCCEHRVAISLPFGFPLFPPSCVPETATFHPDFDTSAIYIDDAWEADKSIVKLILHIGRMISGEIFSEVNPFNEEAAEWYKENRASLPFDSPRQEVEEVSNEGVLGLETVEDRAEEVEELSIDTLEDEEFGLSSPIEVTGVGEGGDIDPDFLKLLAKQKRFHTISQELEKCGDHFEGRADLEEKIKATLNEARALMDEAINLDHKGKHREALTKLDEADNLVSDSPHLQEERARIQQAHDLLGDWVSKEDEGDSISPDEPSADADDAKVMVEETAPRSMAKEEMTFYDEEEAKTRSKSLMVIGAIALVSLVGTLVFAYFFLGSSMSKAEKRYAECQNLLDANDFKGAEQKCQEALNLITEVQVVKQGDKTALTGEIRSLLDSPKLLHGLAGETLVDGRYVSQDTKEFILAFGEEKKKGNDFFTQEKWEKAEQSYNKALDFGQKGGIEPDTLAGIRVKQEHAQYKRLVAEAEAAFFASSWQTAEKQLREALELAAKNPGVMQEERDSLKLLAKNAEFNSLRSMGHELFKEKNWSEALAHYQNALALAGEVDLQEADTSSLNEDIARTKIYLTIAKGKEAFAAAQWDTVISQYENAISLLEENSTLLKEINTEESREKLARIMLHAAIIRDKKEVARSLKAEEYELAVTQLEKIRKTITDSRFSDNQEFKTIREEISQQIGDSEKQQLIFELSSHLTDNYEKLFLKHYPAADRSLLSDPKVEYLKDIGSNLLFRMQCTETTGGRPLRLQMDYLYVTPLKSWQFYSEEE